MSIRISAPEDAGNIEIRELRGDEALLSIRPDNAAPFRQWFHFRCQGAQGRPLTLRVVDAAACSYPRGWRDYRAVASCDGEDWFRVPTEYHDGSLTISHTPPSDDICYAYFAPYPLARRAALIDRAVRAKVRADSLAETPDGRELPCLAFGRGERPVWIIARQHPGESMAEWFAEGLIHRLIAAPGADPEVERFLSMVTLFVVPCVNPDGAYRGNHRTNARGADLNRAWLAPDAINSPEVLAIRDRMDRTGVALALDIHGDEEIPYNFASGGEGTPSWDPARAEQKRAFLESWLRASPDFQTRHGYTPPEPGAANLSICSHQLAERFGCLSLTVESPFLDHNDRPDPRDGWSPARARALGASVITPILSVLS